MKQVRLRLGHTDPFKSRVFIFRSPSVFPDRSPASFQSQVGWGLVFLVQLPCAERDVGLVYLTLQGEVSQLCCPFLGYTMGMGSDPSVSLSLLLILMWPLPYIHSCGKSALLVFRSFSVQLLMCKFRFVAGTGSTIRILPFCHLDPNVIFLCSVSWISPLVSLISSSSSFRFNLPFSF